MGVKLKGSVCLPTSAGVAGVYWARKVHTAEGIGWGCDRTMGPEKQFSFGMLLRFRSLYE